MKIIVEGSDSSGKTTLAQALSKEFSIPVLKWAQRPKTFDEIFDRFSFLHNKRGLIFESFSFLHNPRGLIFDRFALISEPVYQKVMRRESLIQEGTCIKMLKDLSDTIIIYCRPSLEFIVGEIDPSFFEDHQIEQKPIKPLLFNAYDLFFDKLEESGVEFLKYNFQLQKEKEIIDECRRRQRS